MNKCVGCGAVLQSDVKERIGYIPKEKKSTAQFCERCFRLVHYNDFKMIDLETENVLDTVNQKGIYAFFLVDLLNVNREVMNTYHAIQVPKTLIISKIDYIPKYVKKEKIKFWLQEEYGVKEEILFLSASKNVNISAILNTLEKKNMKCAYLLGYTNSGKSTLVNRIAEYANITVSLVPNTTVDYIKIPLNENYFLIDSPGFQYENPIYRDKEVSFIKRINPKTFLKPITYQLKKGTSLILENTLRIENISPKCNVTLYISNLLEIKKVYEKNEDFKHYSKCEYFLKKNEDVVIQGLGFMNIKSDCKVNIYIENPKWLEIRNSFFERQ